MSYYTSESLFQCEFKIKLTENGSLFNFLTTRRILFLIFFYSIHLPIEEKYLKTEPYLSPYLRPNFSEMGSVSLVTFEEPIYLKHPTKLLRLT